MTDKKENKGIIIRKEKTTLVVPHSDHKLVYAYPSKGPGCYLDVIKQIAQEGLHAPTMAETISLVYAAFQNPDEGYSAEIIGLLEKKLLWAFTGNLYVPDKGVYIEDNPKIKDNTVILSSESNLIKRLESGDNSVRFVPFGYEIGKQSPLKLSKHPLIIGYAKEEGAEKLAEIADKHKLKPYVWALDKVIKKMIPRVTALGSINLGFSSYFGIHGICLPNHWNGHALGIEFFALG